MGDWFVTVDLKDAYFHIPVNQRHKKFLRFAFGGKAYQLVYKTIHWVSARELIVTGAGKISRNKHFSFI